MSQIETIQVLLVEDNPSDAFLIRAALKQSGNAFAVAHVETLEDARRELAGDGKFDVVVGDLNLPDSEHDATLEYLLEVRQAMPVVVLHSSDDEELAKRCDACGAVCYSKHKLFDEAFAETVRSEVEAQSGKT